jgi:hypothetical protein
MAMLLKMLGLGPVIGGSAASPRASANVWIENIDPLDTVDDVTRKVIDFVAPSVRFTVPGGNGTSAYDFTLLYLTSVVPEMVSDKQAVASCEWGQLTTAAPLMNDPNNPGQTRSPSQTPTTEVLGPEYNFDTAGGTKHVTQSVYNRYAISSTVAGNFGAPDVKRAVGVSKDGVAGVDIASGDLKWSVRVKGVRVTSAYIDTLVNATGKINRFTWYGREQEELLFLGASGSHRAGEGWEVTYNFHQSKNRTNVKVSNDLTVPVVRGHDYLWVTYKDSVVSDFKVQVPKDVYCEQVYETADFDDLEI